MRCAQWTNGERCPEAAVPEGYGMCAKHRDAYLAELAEQQARHPAGCRDPLTDHDHMLATGEPACADCGVTLDASIVCAREHRYVDGDGEVWEQRPGGADVQIVTSHPYSPHSHHDYCRICKLPRDQHETVRS